MLVVLDTNVVVSTYAIRTGQTIARIRDAWHSGAFEVAVSSSILEEYRRVFNYPRVVQLHGKTAQEIDTDIDRIRLSSLLVEQPTPVTVIEADPSDNEFLACAIAAGASIVVSGDPHLLELGSYQGVQIVTPATFIALLESQAS